MSDQRTLMARYLRTTWRTLTNYIDAMDEADPVRPLLVEELERVNAELQALAPVAQESSSSPRKSLLEALAGRRHQRERKHYRRQKDTTKQSRKEADMNSSYVVGLDLGTKNSCVVVILQDEVPTIITSSEGGRLTPSVVLFDKNHQSLVGEPAKATRDVKNTIYAAKRLMGRSYDDVMEQKKSLPYKVCKADSGEAWIESHGKPYSPSHIGALILLKMKKSAEDFLQQPVTDAVLTVPSSFNEAQRQATVYAATLAGINGISLVNESQAYASALAYSLEDNCGYIAVYKLGGGTFDVSIFKLSSGLLEVKATKGESCLGGDDFNICLVDYIVDEFKRTHHVDITNDKCDLQRLREAAEEAKINLSSADQTLIDLGFSSTCASGAGRLKMTLTRSTFEGLITGLIERTRKLCLNCLHDAGISVEDIAEVLLVGGMTRVPKVQEVVADIFGNKPCRLTDLDEAAAIGAAIEGRILFGDA